MKKLLSVFLAAAMVLSLAACGQAAPAATEAAAPAATEAAAPAATEAAAPAATEAAAPAAEAPIELVYQTTAAQDMITAAFAEYQKSHPNVTLNVQVIDDSEQSTKYIAQADTHTLPDFGWANGTTWVDLFRQTTAVKDLTDIIKTEFDGVFVDNTFDMMTADDKLVAFPAEMQIQGWLVNEKVFRDLGLAVPTNFAELLNAAKVFKENGLVLCGSGTGDNWPTWMWYNWLQLWGVEDNKEALFVTHEMNWEGSDPEKALYKMAELREAGAFQEINSTLSYEQSKALLVAGKCGILPTSTDQLTGVINSDADKAGDIKYWLGIEFEDSPYNQKYTVKVVNNGFGVSADITEEKLAVLIDFFKFFYSADGAAVVMKEGMSLPTTAEVTADVSPLVESISALLNEPGRTAVSSAVYAWWNSWNLRFDCEAAYNDWAVNGIDVALNGLVDGSITAADLPGLAKKYDKAIQDTIEWLKVN